jgi:hypothetical protein
MSDYTFAAYFWSMLVVAGVTGPVLAGFAREALVGIRSFGHCG